MVSRREFEVLEWMADRLVTLGDIADYFRMARSDVTKLVKSLMERDLVEPSGSHRKAVNGYPIVLYQRTGEPVEMSEDEPTRPVEWKPLWTEMRLGEYRSLSGTPTIHRLED